MDPILIVDDEKDNLDALRRLLRQSFNVVTTVSPFEALRIAQQSVFHVIVSDQRMPEMSGVELLEKMKHVTPSSVRILLTGFTDIDSVIGAINRGNIYRYIAKPWDPEDFKLTLRQANEAFTLRREIEKKNVALVESNEELQKALQELTLLDQAKARFLSLVSHELNTPLTVIQSFIQLLSEHSKTLPKDVRPAVGAIQGAANRLTEIIREVLAYVRLESSAKLNRQEFFPVRELERLLTELPDDQKAQVTVKGEKDLKVEADSVKLRSALQLLLQDALQRAPKDSSVEVSVKEWGERWGVTLSRKGQALSAEDFQPFGISEEVMHHHKNLGLALATAKLSFELHGGRLELEKSTSDLTSLTAWAPKRDGR